MHTVRLDSLLIAVNVMVVSIGWQYSMTSSSSELATVRNSLAMPFLQVQRVLHTVPHRRPESLAAICMLFLDQVQSSSMAGQYLLTLRQLRREASYLQRQKSLLN